MLADHVEECLGNPLITSLGRMQTVLSDQRPGLSAERLEDIHQNRALVDGQLAYFRIEYRDEGFGPRSRSARPLWRQCAEQDDHAPACGVLNHLLERRNRAWNTGRPARAHV